MQLSPLAKGIALGDGFNLDYLGAELAHQARGEGSCDQRSDFENPDSIERASHLEYLLFLDCESRLREDTAAAPTLIWQ
ncbi:hypothetical protein D9M71_624050 [compost metagenome]